MTEFPHPGQILARFRRRATVAMLFVLICFGVLVARLYFLQVVRFDHYHARAEGNRMALLPIVPNRGVIRDAKGRELARNYSAYTLEINPSLVKNMDATIERLSRIVTIEERDRRRFYRQLKDSKYFESVPIRTHLTDEEVARIVARRYRFPGVEVQARLFRDYPEGIHTAHVIGYIGRINDRDLEKINENDDTANYRGSEYIGKSGLEESYEKELHGTTGFEQVEINAGGRAMRSLSSTEAQPGNDLELTLDIELQKVAEDAFAGRRGALVAIDPKTGGILALVSLPSFDPNEFIEGISTQSWRALSDSPDHPLLNRAIYSAYPPGSTFKPFMAMAGLETGRRAPGQYFSRQGYFSFAGHTYYDHKSKCQTGVNIHISLTYSCNIFYYQLAQDLGIDAIAKFMRPFDFGHRTGIDISGEAEGVLPSPEWKRKRFKKPEQQAWFGGETLSVGIGQGYNAYTPLQMANALAALVNYGVMYRPHLVKNIIDSRTGERRPVEAEPMRTIKLRKRNVTTVLKAMADVTRLGTAKTAFRGATYSAGGKTGTAQVFSLHGQRYSAARISERLRDHSWFIGFAPAQDPQIVLAVLVENGGFGSVSAAPIARQVMDYHLLGPQGEEAAESTDAEADAATTASPAQ
ncbi:MAG: penicillin-binding protein 2 [Rhodocyclaceae bacterium]|nr:penicillin-binding protein 2 [Rhodocyclaceae bacterium]MBR4736600.1 penicillin-binding protein 2 [Rhodocyclaceae bacterium]